MAAIIYDSATGAFKDAETPLIYDAAAGAYKGSTGLVYDAASGAWAERWGTIEYLFKSGYGSSAWKYETLDYNNSGYRHNDYQSNAIVQNRTKLVIDMYVPDSGDVRYGIKMGTKVLASWETRSKLARQLLEFDISGLNGNIQIYLESNSYAGYGLKYSGDISDSFIHLYRYYNSSYTNLYVYNVWTE